MTETEWLACKKPQSMLKFLQGKVSDRKLRLLALWIAAKSETLDAEYMAACERHADGLATEDDRRLADVDKWAPAWEGAGMALHYYEFHLAKIAGRKLHEYQASMLREICGNPFRPITLDLSWLTSTVTSLANAIYTDRAFDRMPILADALEDSGCNNADILDHCRQPAEHCRGCWALDLVLGKS